MGRLAADAAIELGAHREEVLVAELGSVACWLERRHDELVFFGDFLLHALLHLRISYLVLDLVQLKFEGVLPVADTCLGAADLVLE